MALLLICLGVIGISTFEVIITCKSMILAREYFINEVSTAKVVSTRKSMNLALEYFSKESRA